MKTKYHAPQATIVAMTMEGYMCQSVNIGYGGDKNIGTAESSEMEFDEDYGWTDVQDY